MSAPARARRLLLTGGRQGRLDTKKPEWQRYAEARIGILDLDSGKLEIALRYQTRPEHRPDDDPSITFKAGSVAGDELVVTDLTEVLVLDRNLAIRQVVSHPCFNDLHHVARIGGRLHVVSTGLDSLVVLDQHGEVADIRHALGDDVWTCFDRATDYRKVSTTKPHRSHPNFVFENDSGLWLTRFEQRDAVCLDDPARRVDIGVGNPHDGQQIGDTIWFTTTNGHLVEGDTRSCEVRRRIDLNQLDGRGIPLGWCRGLYVEGDIAYVGFTRLRRTKIAKNLSWVRRGFRGYNVVDAVPTRVVAYDLERGERVEEWMLADTGLDTIFSIVPWG
jgi:hypothetical protein